MPRKAENALLDRDDLTTGRIESELTCILESEGFARAPRLCEFLRFVVEEELEGRGKRINGTQIAIDVYGRDENFDPRTDPVVRTEAGRLRRALERYYLTDGNLNPIRIQIPKGGYRPVFEIVSEPDIEDTGKLPLEDDDPCAEILPIPDGAVIAVLPFRNLDGNADKDYFAAGFTGELTTALTRFDLLQVIAQQSTARYQGKRIDVRQVGRELGARFVLEGSIQWHDDRVRVTVALSDVEDGTPTVGGHLRPRSFCNRPVLAWKTN